jgi:hypothetical protein
MYDGFLSYSGIARTPEVVHAVEALNAVCTSPEPKCAVQGDE